MKATTLSLALILVGTTGVLPDDMKMPVNASQLEWAQAPNFVPEGAQIAVLSGDPSKDGPYVIRFRCLPDTRSRPTVSLLKTRPSERLQIMVAFGFAFEGHLAGEPRERKVWLDAEQRFEGLSRQLSLFGHRGGGCE